MTPVTAWCTRPLVLGQACSLHIGTTTSVDLSSTHLSEIGGTFAQRVAQAGAMKSSPPNKQLQRTVKRQLCAAAELRRFGGGFDPVRLDSSLYWYLWLGAPAVTMIAAAYWQRKTI